MFYKQTNRPLTHLSRQLLPVRPTSPLDTVDQDLRPCSLTSCRSTSSSCAGALPTSARHSQNPDRHRQQAPQGQASTYPGRTRPLITALTCRTVILAGGTLMVRPAVTTMQHVQRVRQVLPEAARQRTHVCPPGAASAVIEGEGGHGRGGGPGTSGGSVARCSQGQCWPRAGRTRRTDGATCAEDTGCEYRCPCSPCRECTGDLFLAAVILWPCPSRAATAGPPGGSPAGRLEICCYFGMAAAMLIIETPMKSDRSSPASTSG